MLNEQQTIFRDMTLQTITRICDRELSDPSQIDLFVSETKKQYPSIVKHFEDSYRRVYDKIDPSARPQWSNEDLTRSFGIMAIVTVWLHRGAARVSDVLGREAQGQLLDYVDSVIPALRNGFDLEEVHDRVKKRARKVLEPNQDVVMRRERLEKRRRELEEIG